MTPGAQVAASIELLDAIDTGSAAADRTVALWLRRHRYAGSKDRAAIQRRIYGVLRGRGLLDWKLARCGAAPDARRRVLAFLAQETGAAEVEALFAAATYGPPTLTDDERRLLAGLREMPPEAPPAWARDNVPPWLHARLEASLGDDIEREMVALAGEAPFDLRVDTAQVVRDTVVKALAPYGALPTPISPIGVRLPRRQPIGDLALTRAGQIEPQDEGAQIVSILVGAAPGETVIDYCAGAGGKALALASLMGQRGRVIAADTDETRLARLAPRLARGPASIIATHVLDGAAPTHAHLPLADRVLVDAPCSNIGAWRRRPEGRWRLTDERLMSLIALQRDILDRAAAHVRPGGRLVYATCSLLDEENERQADAFGARHTDFAVVPVAPEWERLLGTPCPATGRFLTLTPARHGTDGFFVALFARA